jgi:hypothetical protein
MIPCLKDTLLNAKISFEPRKKIYDISLDYSYHDYYVLIA